MTSARDTLSEVQLREIQETVDLSALQHSQAMLQVDSRFQSLVNEISDIRLSVTRSRSQTRKMIQESQSLNLKDKRFDLLVDSLKFKMINAREEEIRDAHASTFNWIFDPSGKPLSGIIQSSRFGKSRWDNFVEWLEYGTGIYWINGKAGSGKSTVSNQNFGSVTSTTQLEKERKETYYALVTDESKVDEVHQK